MAKAAEQVEAKQLPLFEGRRPDAAEVGFTGTVTAGDNTDPLHVGQRVWFVVEGYVSGVNHTERVKRDVTEFIRAQKLTVTRAHRMDDSEGSQVMRDLFDAERGVTPLFRDQDHADEVAQDIESKMRADGPDVSVEVRKGGSKKA